MLFLQNSKRGSIHQSITNAHITKHSRPLPHSTKKKNILMTVLQEVTTVALRIKDQVCCPEPVSYKLLHINVRRLLYRHYCVCGGGEGHVPQDNLDRFLLLASSFSRGQTLRLGFHRCSVQGHTVCTLCMFLESQMNSGLPFYMTSLQLESRQVFTRPSAEDASGFRTACFEFLRVKTQKCCCRAKTKLEVRPHLLLLLWR